MKKYFFTLIALIGFGIVANAECSWEVYPSSTTNDGKTLTISYDNSCDYTVKVEVKYKVISKPTSSFSCKKEKWIEEVKTETFYLQPRVSNYWLIGSYSSYYNDCTTRYEFIKVEPK